MEPLLDLPIDQFFGALNELGLDPERRADLLREYRRRNSAFSPVYGLLDSVADEDAAAGMQRADIVPISRPEGMSVFEAIRSGDWRLAVPQGALDAVGNVAGALDVPAAAAAGLIPREDMVGEALNAAGVVMGLGGLLARPAGSLGTGGRVASRSGDETPAQQVARLLREGRADEVTDDLMAQADPQEMYQLYVSGETGMDLPMDEASRMARAREMGFLPQDTYHATSYDIPAVDLDYAETGMSMGNNERAFWTTTEPRTAETYLPGAYVAEGRGGAPMGGGVERYYSPQANIIPVRQRYDEAVTWEYGGGGYPQGGLGDDLAEAAAEGADTVVFRNMRDPGIMGLGSGSRTNTSVAAFDPRNIRSRFARFDPRLSHLANLNAANIDPLTGAAAMGASQQQQDPLASLRAYLAQNGLLSQ
jgi:hypothetical protein